MIGEVPHQRNITRKTYRNNAYSEKLLRGGIQKLRNIWTTNLIAITIMRMLK